MQRRRLLHERRLERLGAFAADEVGAQVEDLQGGVGLARRGLSRVRVRVPVRVRDRRPPE